MAMAADSIMQTITPQVVSGVSSETGGVLWAGEEL
jgi:hypothetical protein